MTTPLLIAGHGTSDEAGAEQFRQFVKRVDGILDAPVAGGFIELSNPPIAEAVDALLAAGAPLAGGAPLSAGALLAGGAPLSAGARRIAAVPLMLVTAGHAKGDIPASLARERQRHEGLSFVYGRPLGPHPTVLALLRERLAEFSLQPETMVLLVGRGSSDPDANAEVARAARLLAETTPVAGVEYGFVSLAAPGVPAGLERCRLLGAKRIVVLPYFLFTGVLPRRVASQAASWSLSSGIPVDTAEVIGDCDGLASLVVERYEEALRGQARANCDTCLYRIALPGHEHRVGAPQMPHDHPHDHAHPRSH